VVHEGHAAEVEDDPVERLLPKGAEDRVDALYGGAVEVARNAEIDESFALMSPECERVRFARDTCSLCSLSRRDTLRAERELERALRA
jgi:hypothetical protein